MTTVTHSLIRPAEGFRSQEAASFFSQMEDQSLRLGEAIRGISPEELEWQPAPGMNTIGMLLAHNAIAEAFWVQTGLLGEAEFDPRPSIGIGADDDGMPLPPGAEPPAGLKGRAVGYYENLLARARAYCREAAAGLSDADMDRQVTRTRHDGTQRVFNIRWALYHMLEHFSGHFGQILVLRRLYRTHVDAPSRAGG